MRQERRRSRGSHGRPDGTAVADGAEAGGGRAPPAGARRLRGAHRRGRGRRGGRLPRLRAVLLRQQGGVRRRRRRLAQPRPEPERGRRDAGAAGAATSACTGSSPATAAWWRTAPPSATSSRSSRTWCSTTELRERVAALYEWYRDLYVEGLGDATTVEEERLRRFASLMVAMTDGLAVQKLLDPDGVELEPLFELWENMLRARAASRPATEPPPRLPTDPPAGRRPACRLPGARLRTHLQHPNRVVGSRRAWRDRMGGPAGPTGRHRAASRRHGLWRRGP